MKRAIDHIQIGRGPLATVFACEFCRFAVSVPKGRRNGMGFGRGYWLGETSKARAEVVQHIRDSHSDQLKEEK